MNTIVADIFIISSLFLIFTNSVLILILFRYGKSRLHLIWGLFNGAILVWVGGLFFAAITDNYQQALTYLRVGFAGAIFISIFFFHVSTFFYPFKKYLLKIAYGQGLVFLIWNISSGDKFLPSAYKLFNSFYYLKLTSLPSLVCFVIWSIWLILGFYALFRAYAISCGAKKLQLKYLVVGMILGWSGGFLYVLPFFNIKAFPFGNFTIPLYCIIVTYAIFRHHLMDISIVFKKTMAYALSTGLLTAFFVVLVLTLTKFLSNVAGITSFTITVIAALTIAVLFNPLKNRIQLLIDKVFYKKTYDYYATVQEVSRNFATMFDLKKIYSFVGDIIFSTVRLKSIYLLSAVSGGDYEVVYHMPHGREKGKGEELKINGNSEIVKILRTSNDIVIKDELPGISDISGQEAIDKIKSTLKSFNGEAVVPVFIDDKLEVLLILGKKLSGDMFTNEDINLLNTISNQTAIAIKNAKLYAEKVKSERLASMGMMSATFAHEIRNPLTSIKTFAQLMPEKHNDPEFQNTFSKIVADGVERIDELIKDFLYFSSEEALSSMVEVDITALMDEIIEYLKVKLELERRKIAVEKNYRDVKINVTGDSKKLKRAFINIINNSCQAMQEDGVLKVSINSDGKNVEIAISDTGEGIPKEDIEKIFDPFYTTREIGVGLGLAISKRIIEDHGGKIRVESKPSKGTTFVVSLPIQKTGEITNNQITIIK